jgi:hypothetical protein
VNIHEVNPATALPYPIVFAREFGQVQFGTDAHAPESFDAAKHWIACLRGR